MVLMEEPILHTGDLDLALAVDLAKIRSWGQNSTSRSTIKYVLTIRKNLVYLKIWFNMKVYSPNLIYTRPISLSKYISVNRHLIKYYW